MVSKTLSNSLRFLTLEFFVIVVGVLIALAIDEWRQNIENENREHVYVQQLIVDLRATEDLLAESESHASKGMESIAKLVDTFNSNASIESDELIENIYTSFNFNNPIPVLGTIDSLVATGDLRLIRDLDTQSAITRYLSYANGYLITPIYDVEERFNDYSHQILKLAVADGILTSTSEYALSRDIQPNVEAFLANREAYVVVLGMRDLSGFFVWYRDLLNVKTKELREILENRSN